MSAPLQRPRLVSAAFWCWLVGAILLAALGLFLAGRTRTGHAGFRRAAVGLALALVVVLALFILVGGGVLWVLPMIFTLIGAVLIMRPSAQEWFPSEEQP